jgi:hypothetical protein
MRSSGACWRRCGLSVPLLCLVSFLLGKVDRALGCNATCNQRCLSQSIYLISNPGAQYPLRDYQTGNQALRAYYCGAGDTKGTQLGTGKNYYVICSLGSWDCGPDDPSNTGGLPANGTGVDPDFCQDNEDYSIFTTCKAS